MGGLVNEPRREWQGHIVAFGWIVVVTLGYRMREGVRSVAFGVSWSRRTVDGYEY